MKIINKITPKNNDNTKLDSVLVKSTDAASCTPLKSETNELSIKNQYDYSESLKSRECSLSVNSRKKINLKKKKVRAKSIDFKNKTDYLNEISKSSDQNKKNKKIRKMKTFHQKRNRRHSIQIADHKSPLNKVHVLDKWHYIEKIPKRGHLRKPSQRSHTKPFSQFSVDMNNKFDGPPNRLRSRQSSMLDFDDQNNDDNCNCYIL